MLVPSLSDCLFWALTVWLFVAGAGWTVLLADGDTGWHIRTGELILDQGRVPHQDPFSYTKPGAEWYAWEWLADVIFALAHRAWGLKGVVLLAGVAITGALLALFRYALWRGANPYIALAAVLLSSGAAGVHFLARPHVFTLVLLPVSLWMLERGLRRPDGWVWLLPALTVVWANLHGGFLAFLVVLGLVAAERAAAGVWRYAVVLAASAAGTLLNPYGIGLHRHILEYLKSDWIRQAVDEFQSPKFRSESSIHFEILLLAGMLTAAALARRREFAWAGAILVWAHAALVSVRHVPVFAMVGAPLIAVEATRWVRSGMLARLGEDYRAAFGRTSLWTPALVIALALMGAPLRWPADFPALKFPTGLVARCGKQLVSARVFSTDQWGGYLIYRGWPRQKVFIDGRSDFYGAEMGKLYLRTAYAHRGWDATLDRYGVELVLADRDWPLAARLEESAAWRRVDQDGAAILFERVQLKSPAAPAEPRAGGREHP